MAANFCFNFEIPEQNPEFSINEEKSGHKEVKGSVKAEATFLNPNQNELEVVLKGNYEAKEVEIAGFDNGPSSRLVHLSEAFVENLIRNSEEYSTTASKRALESNTDLIPSFYEGGLKIWECSLDLVNHLNRLFLENKLYFQDKAVLELGCGAGLPGIYACLKGASVCFQDYNAEVLKLFTIPNVALSMNSGNSFDFSRNPTLLEKINRCKFLSGDWEFAKSLLEPMSFDVILTSETIYNSDVQKSLYELIKFVLKPSGVAFVAAKSYYFGVGGGTDQFSQLVKQDGAFDISNLTMCSEGVKREILVMKRK
ncbi:histidine protein methyltransferase 1 homolog [Dendronephthya gigantea]|uniref:histidine protein methyltransferase 1 homolog n=1 Tax=Dendronephthya gigantea TaxID=151771 RepID=UPI001069C7AD|nr:histidine protein methyltransferase 1 homolog [Dendronephthya gigantea]